MTSRPMPNMPLDSAGAATSKKENFPAHPDKLRSEICATYSSFDTIILKEESRNNLRSTDVTRDFRKALHDLVDRLIDAKVESAYNLLAERFSAPELPVKAPELYKERADRTEKPDAFIRRVYEPWLGKGLLRPHIKALDFSLYQSLYKYGIPVDFETLLPKAAGRSPEDIAKSDSDLVATRRAAVRRAEARRRTHRY